MIKHGRTPTVMFGPGVTSEKHAVNEFVPIDNLLTAANTLALAILEWCGFG